MAQCGIVQLELIWYKTVKVKYCLASYQVGKKIRLKLSKLKSRSNGSYNHLEARFSSLDVNHAE